MGTNSRARRDTISRPKLLHAEPIARSSAPHAIAMTPSATTTPGGHSSRDDQTRGHDDDERRQRGNAHVQGHRSHGKASRPEGAPHHSRPKRKRNAEMPVLPT